MEQTYQETKYKNVHGYKATYTNFHTDSANSGLDTEITLERDGESHTYKINEAYRTMLALMDLLRAHDPFYEDKMMSSLETRKEVIL